jgi:chromosome segregation ATPase
MREPSLAPISPPAGSTRLFDLIKVADPEVKVAFYFALQDTLVTDDLKSATKYVTQILPSLTRYLESLMAKEGGVLLH